MSRHFDLMQQLDSDTWFRGRSAPGEAVEDRPGHPAPAAEFGSNVNEEALQLVQRIFLVQGEDAPRVVAFAGVDHGEGCSRISAAVAEILARNSGGTVCLVEANFRSPGLPGLFGTANHHGLADALLHDGPIRSFARPLLPDALWLLSSGALEPGSANLLSSERIRTRMAELRDEFDYVVIDAPPLSRYNDALTVSRLTDGLVLVLEAGTTRRETAQLAAANLRSCEIPILGAVLNNRTFPIPEKIYRML